MARPAQRHHRCALEVDEALTAQRWPPRFVAIASKRIRRGSNTADNDENRCRSKSSAGDRANELHIVQLVTFNGHRGKTHNASLDCDRRGGGHRYHGHSSRIVDHSPSQVNADRAADCAKNEYVRAVFAVRR